jgi:hypothetical protein
MVWGAENEKSQKNISGADVHRACLFTVPEFSAQPGGTGQPPG